jgi:hypothetical protein
VSIDPAFLANDPQAIENQCNSGEPVTMVLASDIISLILQRWFTVSADERRLIQGYCVEVLAGPLAEERLNPLFDARVGARDFAQAGYVLERLEKDKFKRRRKLSSLEKETSDFVARNAPAILFLAMQLFDRKTLHESEIDEILRDPPESIKIPVIHQGTLPAGALK